MKIRIMSICLSVLLIATVVLTGCSSKTTPTPQPTTSAPATSAPATTQAPATTTAKPATSSPATSAAPTTPAVSFAARTWQYASPLAADSFEGWTGTGKPFAEELAKLTNNAIKIVPRHSASLLSVAETANGVANGLADFALMNAAAFPALFPSMKIGGINDPLLAGKYPHNEEYLSYLGSLVFNEDMRLHREFNNNKLKPIMLIGAYTQNLFTTKKVTKLEDIKGMKLRLYGGVFQDRFFQAMGATGVSVPITEQVDALAKGIIDGVCSVTGSHYDMKVLDKTPYYLTLPNDDKFTDLYLGGGYLVVMSQSTWSGLSDNEKRALLVAAKAGEEYQFKGLPGEDARAYKGLKEGVGVPYKATFSALPMSDVEKLMAMPQVANQWADLAKELDAAGAPGTKMVNRFNELVKMSDTDLRKAWEAMWAKRIAELW